MNYGTRYPELRHVEIIGCSSGVGSVGVKNALFAYAFSGHVGRSMVAKHHVDACVGESCRHQSEYDWENRLLVEGLNLEARLMCVITGWGFSVYLEGYNPVSPVLHKAAVAAR